MTTLNFLPGERGQHKQGTTIKDSHCSLNCTRKQGPYFLSKQKVHHEVTCIESITLK